MDSLRSTRGLDDPGRDLYAEILTTCADSTEAMGRVFFPNYVYRNFSPSHKQIFDLIDDETKQFVAIAAPRGWGKTTIDGLFLPARKTMFNQIKYGVFVSRTETKAKQDMRTLRRELENPLVQSFFPFKVRKQGGKWSELEFETSNGVWWGVKGADQQIRGIRAGDQRPDLIIIDDFEDPKEVKSKVLREDRKKRFYEDILNSIDWHQTRIIFIGTVLHEDSLLVELLEDPMWTPLNIELCDDSFHSNWPEFLTDDACRALYTHLKRKGRVTTFLREFRNKVVSDEDRSFKPEFFNYYEESALQGQLNKGEVSIDTCVIVDPSREPQTENAYTAIVGVSLDYTHKRILFRDCIMERLHPEEIYQKTVAMARRLGTPNIGVEDWGLHEFIRYPFENYVRSKGAGVITWLKPRGREKEQRIAALVPFYRMGQVYHNSSPGVHGPLETQLSSFPFAKYNDVADAFAYCLEMLHVNDVLLGVDMDDADRVRVVDEATGEETYIAEDEMSVEEMAAIDREREPALTRRVMSDFDDCPAEEMVM